jgi:Putative transmembrane protein (Alph_Pro_TM).
MQYNNIFRIFLILILYIIFYSNLAYSNEAYFDLSDSEIEIQTNFKGKEVIIFGLLEPGFDTIINIKGPKKDTKVRKKERIFVFWFNTKKIVYKNLSSIFYIASSSPIKEILEEETIIKNALNFEQSLANIVTQRNFNFNDKNKPEYWNRNLLKIKKDENFYKEYKIKIVDDKLFQTKIFFPSNTIPGIYNVDIFQIKTKL